jgi:hypothetical protein
MARFPMQFSAQDQQGKTIAGATATVSLAGTTTAAIIYDAKEGGSVIAGGIIIADDNGFVKFWADTDDYDSLQFFKVTITGSRFKTTVLDDVVILPGGLIDSARLDVTDNGVRLGAANARVTTILDEDDMSSDSATALCTQQSIKKYIDDAIAAL